MTDDLFCQFEGMDDRECRGLITFLGEMEGDGGPVDVYSCEVHCDMLEDLPEEEE